MTKRITHLGYPKYKYKDTVSFLVEGKLKIGYVEYIDAWGTFEQAEEPSYDIYVASENCLYKHFRESKVFPYKTFDNFFVNQTNQDAVSLARTAAENCGTAVNPLFIHGKTGTGKSHLALAIEYEVKKNPEMKVEILTCEDLLNRITDFMKYRDGRPYIEFCEEFAKLDLLIIEDVDLMEGKLSTQQLIGQLIRYLCEGRRKLTQVVLTASQYKEEIYDFLNFYFLKLKNHAMVEIKEADEELKRICIQAEAKSLDINVSERATAAIIQRMEGIGSIHAVLRDAKAYAAIFDKPLDDAMIWRVVDVRSRGDQ